MKLTGDEMFSVTDEQAAKPKRLATLCVSDILALANHYMREGNAELAGALFAYQNALGSRRPAGQ